MKHLRSFVAVNLQCPNTFVIMLSYSMAKNLTF